MSDISANDSMLEMFLFEMTSLLDQLDEILLASEKNKKVTHEDVNEIFRIMHTFKGSSAMMEFSVIAGVTHKLEDCFYLIRENGIEESHFSQLFDVMLDATDFLKSQLESIQSGKGEQSAGNEELLNRAIQLYEALSGKGQETAPAAPAAEPEQSPEAVAPLPADTSAHTASAPEVFAHQFYPGLPYQVDVLFEEDCGMENLRAFMLVESLKKSCAVLSFDPHDIETNPDSASAILVHGFSIILESDMDPDDLQILVEESSYVKTAVITPISEKSVQSASDITGDVYEAVIKFEEDCGMENLRSFMLLNSLRATCKIISYTPQDIESNPSTADEIITNGFSFTLETAMSEKELRKTLEESLHVRSAQVSRSGKSNAPEAAPVKASAPVSQASPPPAQTASVPASSSVPSASPKPAVAASAAPSSPSAPSSPAAATNRPVKQNLINVSLSKLDELMDLMGELVITESMVTRSPDLAEVIHLDNFNKSARQLRKLTDELQDMVMSIRMVPISGTFQRMQRIVRDMCRSLGKTADLVTMGEETDIDKTIVDGLADPIMHLVRNSMDHGVETPEERRAAGKNPNATITLSAQNTGGEILITVSDDGKGLDAEKLLAKAKANGILTKPASEYTEKETFQLLMLPGFSTKEEVTEYSGRGVGMDVVKKNIEKIGGTVVIESKKGYGMSIFLKIPLTLAIVDGMNIRVGDGVYTLQITSISESFKITDDNRDQLITDTDGNEMIMIRGDVVPIIRLHQLYGVPEAVTNFEEGILVLVENGDQSACLFIDELLGMQQIVVKPLPVYLARYDIKPYGISGCTILGDGNISLILDVGSIIDKVMEKR